MQHRARRITPDDAEATSGAPELRPFDRSLPMALLRTREAVMRHFRPSLQAAGLTEQQWRTLRALDGLAEIEVTRLASLTCLLAPSLTRILRDLEARRFVTRRAAPRDARVSLIALSAEGSAVLRQVGAHSEAVYEAIERRLGGARLEKLMRELAEVEGELGLPLGL